MVRKERFFESALHVREGVEEPSSVNPYVDFKKKKKRELSVDEYVEGIISGNRVILSRAITMIESVNPEHFAISQAIIEKCLPYSDKSIRIGITGVPGVGKSTFIESVGKHITSLGHRLAVLAIDPSSQRSKGSILGDKTRMESLAVDRNAYIRPSPSGLTLGGVARKTRETVILCEAAGFDVILIETVGVGQSETVVKSMVDFFLLLMLAGAGDELQGIKRGIMEMADAIVITKADGDNRQRADLAKSQFQSALHLFPANENGWKIPVKTCSSIENKDIDQVWQVIKEFEAVIKENGFFDKTRHEQWVNIFYEWMDNSIKDSFYSKEVVKEEIARLLPAIKSGSISPYQAGLCVLEIERKKSC